MRPPSILTGGGDDPGEVVVLLTTLPADADARVAARALVTARLAACVSIAGDMVSVYRWQGSVEESPERQLVIKTTRGQVARVGAWLAEHHPYEVPELLVLSVDGGGDAYLAWVRECTGS